MNTELMEAIEKYEKLGYLEPAFIPILRKYRDEAIPYYLEILKKAAPENAPDLLDSGLWTAFFIMGENHVEEAFPHLLRVFHLDEEAANSFGDMITESLKNILYHTYNGDLNQLCELMGSENVCYYIREAALFTITQLYLDGIVSREKFISILREEANRLIKAGDDATHISTCIADLHLFEMEDVLRRIVEEKLYEYFIIGNPLVILYDASEKIEDVCSDVVTLEDGLNYKHHAVAPDAAAAECGRAQTAHLEKYLPEGCTLRPSERYEFTVPEVPEDIRTQIAEEEKRQDDEIKNSPLAQLFYNAGDRNPRSVHYPEPVVKSVQSIGRNDPCPCGSGKKYKKCCMLKQNGT